MRMKVQLHESNQKMKVNFGQVQMSGGDPGFSPIVDLVETEAGVDITVTDAEGVKRATVRNGRDGEDGYTPEKGKDYFDGQDGFSPVVAVQDITGGHRVTITDKDGNKTFDVMDGQGGGAGGSVENVFEYVWDRADFPVVDFEPLLGYSYKMYRLSDTVYDPAEYEGALVKCEFLNDTGTIIPVAQLYRENVEIEGIVLYRWGAYSVYGESGEDGVTSELYATGYVLVVSDGAQLGIPNGLYFGSNHGSGFDKYTIFKQKIVTIDKKLVSGLEVGNINFTIDHVVDEMGDDYFRYDWHTGRAVAKMFFSLYELGVAPLRIEIEVGNERYFGPVILQAKSNEYSTIQSFMCVDGALHNVSIGDGKFRTTYTPLLQVIAAGMPINFKVYVT